MSPTSADEAEKEVSVSAACTTYTGRVPKSNLGAFIVADLTEAESLSSPVEAYKRPVGSHGLLLAVAYGLSAEQAGDTASQMAVGALARYLVTAPNERPMSGWLNQGLRSAGREVRLAGQSNTAYRGMGAAIVAAVVHYEQVVTGQVGDAHGYLIRGREVRQLTKDQTHKQARPSADVQCGEEVADGTPRRNVIRAVGAEYPCQPCLSFVMIERGDNLLLCSGNLSEKVDDAEVRDIVRETSSPGEACRRLVALADERGAEGDVTLIVARFDGAGWPLTGPGEAREIQVGYL